MKRNPPLIVLPLAFAVGALCISLLSAGCSSTGGGAGNVLNCDNAKIAYELYQSSLLVRQPSKEEIIAAKLAGVFLAAKCGWTQATLPAAPGARGVPVPQVDENGVPVVLAP